MKAVIISGGTIEDEFALEWLRSNPYDMLLVADSGMDFLYRNKICPDVIAGDFDSVGKMAYEYFIEKKEAAGERPEILRLNPMKDDTDTEFVIREAIRRGADAITLLGATGTRLDHVLGNIHLLGSGLSRGIAMELVDSHNRIRMMSEKLVLKKAEQFGRFVSILPFGTAAKGVTLTGFLYPLQDAYLESFCSLGISNEITEEQAVIQVKEGILLVIESRD